MTQIKFNFTF